MGVAIGSEIGFLSIHALHGEGDRSRPSFWAVTEPFNPRPPRGGRPAGARAYVREDTTLSIHALHGEGDVFPDGLPRAVTVFQSTPSTGRATF
mgnify:CR=1 FL=1